MNSEYAIEVSHLTKKFGKNLAVDDISFQVRRGEVFGLLGPNGAGKTTTLRMITTLLKQTSGQITVFGHNTLKDSKAARATFGLTGQYASVDEDISARENLLIFSRLNGLTHVASKQRATELLEEFSLTESADKPIAELATNTMKAADLSQVKAELTLDNQPLVAGDSSEVLGNPLNSLQWLVKKLESQGQKLKKGQRVSSGTFVLPPHLTKGHYLCHFSGDFGDVSLDVK
jgi:ABC-type lipopolysaccharide export system ATPase subunit